MSLSRRELIRRLGAFVLVAPFIKPSSIAFAEELDYTVGSGDVWQDLGLQPPPVEVMPPEFDVSHAKVVDFDFEPVIDLDDDFDSISRFPKKIEGSIEAGGINTAAMEILTGNDPYSWQVLSTFTKPVGSLHHQFVIHGLSLTSNDYPQLQ